MADGIAGEGVQRSAVAAQIESVLPGYRVGEELGRGGVGVVYDARHIRLDRPVAIKRLPESFARDPGVRRRFLKEAKLLAALDHPHIVPIYDFIDEDGLCLVVMEHLGGGSVLDWRQTAAISRADACATVLAASAGVSFAHEHQILHRDLKPANLMFSSSGVVKVVDFGIAKMLGGQESLATAAGDVIGSPMFMAPEQVSGDPVSPATDVYALATVLYDLLSGQFPFDLMDSHLQLLVAKVRSDARDIRSVANVPGPLADVAMRGLSREPQHRFATAEEFGVALARAATAALGEGWLTGDRRLYATGDLLRALDHAHADARSPESLVAVPRSAQLERTPTMLNSREVPVLVPLPDMVDLAAGSVARVPTPAAGDRSRPSGDGTPTDVLRHQVPPPPPSQPPSVPRLRLEIDEPDRERRRIEVRDTTVFGRACDGVVLEDSEISRSHFSIAATARGFVLEDLRSTNGTYCNGSRLAGPHLLRPHDVIDIGNTRLEVLD